MKKHMFLFVLDLNEKCSKVVTKVASKVSDLAREVDDLAKTLGACAELSKELVKSARGEVEKL